MSTPSDLKDWVGNQTSRDDQLAPFPANALAATLDRDDPKFTVGIALPDLWHWLYFLPVFKLSKAGRDGHEALGQFLPPVPLPRRMWAGSRLSFHAPLRIGQTLSKISRVKSVQEKTGRSGALVFVTVSHQIFDGDQLCVDEEQDLVYREEPAPGAPHPIPVPAPETSEFHRDIIADPVFLFRYSALTFNGHRIHYDYPFSTESEGHDGLVVHGPLLATLLLDLLRRERPFAKVASFEFRALATIYGDEPFSVHGAQDDNGHYTLWARRADGALAMNATVTLKTS